MRLLSFVFLLFGFLLIPGFAQDKPADLAASKAGLQKLGEFVGEWNMAGKAKVDGRDTSWKETLNLGWKFKDAQAWISLESKDGKYFTTGTLQYDPKQKQYELNLVDSSLKSAKYEGKLQRGNLILTRKDESSGDVSRLTLYTLADGSRMVLKLELQAKGKGLFSEQFSLAGTKEGESFAGGGAKKPECVVTGGAGTIAVSFEGKTYYVCCSGCKDEFEANPKKYAK